MEKILPDRPTNEERVSYVREGKAVAYLSILFGSLGVSISMFLFGMQAPWLWPFCLYGVIFAAYNIFTCAVGVGSRRFSLGKHDKLVATFQKAPKLERTPGMINRDAYAYNSVTNVFAGQLYAPSLDVFVPNCGEPIHILRNTFDYVARIACEGPINFYCLDDAGRAEVEDLAKSFGFIYLSRPDKGAFKKSGNLQYGLLHSSGDFIAIFDADFCPREDFASELLPYMYADPLVGIVQTPQYFNSFKYLSWIERGSAYSQEFFFRSVQASRDSFNAPICCGSNAIYRRSALYQTGGFALMEHSEDMWTGIRLVEQGFKVKYVPLNLAGGLCPDQLKPFFNQQYRWAAGSLRMIANSPFWNSKIPLLTKACYGSGMVNYLLSALGVLAFPLQGSIMALFFPSRVFLSDYIFLIPSLLSYYFILPLWHRNKHAQWHAARADLAAYYAQAYAAFDTLTGHGMTWQPTNSVLPVEAGKNRGRFEIFRSLLTLWTIFNVVCVAYGCSLHMGSLLNYSYWPLIVLTALYAAVSLSVLGKSDHPAHIETVRKTRQFASAGEARDYFLRHRETKGQDIAQAISSLQVDDPLQYGRFDEALRGLGLGPDDLEEVLSDWNALRPQLGIALCDMGVLYSFTHGRIPEERTGQFDGLLKESLSTLPDYAGIAFLRMPASTSSIRQHMSALQVGDTLSLDAPLAASTTIGQINESAYNILLRVHSAKLFPAPSNGLRNLILPAGATFAVERVELLQPTGFAALLQETQKAGAVIRDTRSDARMMQAQAVR